ncbi:MAG TPA: aroma-sacti cluster domain-containing protein [Streptosporangiaceae bacterium]|jgi:hypothetical protein
MTDPHDPNDTADALERLRTAGFDLGMFSDEQLELLAALDEGELNVLLDIKERIGDIRPEVEAHAAKTIGGLLF